MQDAETDKRNALATHYSSVIKPSFANSIK